MDPLDTNLLNETVEQLRDHIRISNETSTQSANVSLNFLKVPEFRGMPNEDIFDFIKDYERSTSLLSDEHKCLAINRALLGAAATWSKTIKDVINNGKWKRVRRLLLDRFGTVDYQDRHRQKLSNLKFDPTKTTLLSFAEIYTDTYRKAFKNQSDNDAIRQIRCTLPDNIVKCLNYLDDGWSKYPTIEELYQLIKRYQSNIEPYEKDQENNSKSLDTEAVGKMILDFKKDIMNMLKLSQPNVKNNETLAVMSNQPKVTQGNPDKSGQPEAQPYSRVYNQSPQVLNQTHPLAYNTPMYHQGHQYYQVQQPYHPRNQQPFVPRYAAPYRQGPPPYQAQYRPQYNQQRHPYQMRYNQPRNNYQDSNNKRPIEQPDASSPKQPRLSIEGQPEAPVNAPKVTNNDYPRMLPYKANGPPGPCFHCGGNHWNNDCDQKKPNLN